MIDRKILADMAVKRDAEAFETIVSEAKLALAS